MKKNNTAAAIATLTDNQRSLLTAALSTDGRLVTFPASLRGGARTKVLQTLVKAGVIRARGDGHVLTPKGYAALGHDAPTAAPAGKGKVTPAKAAGKGKVAPAKAAGKGKAAPTGAADAAPTKR